MLWKWREKRLQHAWPVHYVTICSNNLQLYLNVFTRVSSSIYNLISLIFHLFFHFALPIVLFFNFFMWVTVHSDSYGWLFRNFDDCQKNNIFIYFLFFSLSLWYFSWCCCFWTQKHWCFGLVKYFSSFCCVCFALVLALAVTLIIS